MVTTWTPQGFVDYVRDVDAHRDDRRFCFVLGAGASRSSGIPVASELARRWIADLHRRASPDVPLAAWLSAGGLGIPDFDPKDPARFYPEIYARRFEGDPEGGHAWLEDAMRKARPSFGYYVLARILSETRHRTVVTTNFDNLVAEALLQAAGTHALVCGHESLAPFARATPRRPMVAKIHRDLLLAPVSDPDGVASLAPPWEGALRAIFQTSTPIFLGYGGNDGSLMGLLESLEPGEVPPRPLWCFWYREVPPPRVEALMARLGGVLVPIRDFDAVMMDLNHALGYDLPLDRLEARAREQVEWYRSEVERVVRAAEATASGGGDDAAAAARGSIARTEGSWQVVLRVQMTSDPVQQRALFEDGLRSFPEDVDLRARFADWLRARGAPAEAVSVADAGVVIDPHHGEILAARGRARAAAAASSPARERLLADAVLDFERAASLDKRRPSTLHGWANVLLDRGGAEDTAEELLQEAVASSGRRDADVLCDLGVLRFDHHGDHAGAEALWREALQIDPDHRSVLANLAELAVCEGRCADAVRAARQLWRLGPDPARRRTAAWLAGVAISASGGDDAPALGLVRGLLGAGSPGPFAFDGVLASVGPLLPPPRRALYARLARACRGEEPAGRVAADPALARLLSLPDEVAWARLDASCQAVERRPA